MASETDLDAITNQLSATKVDAGVELSFLGRGLKLNTENDAEEVVNAINECKDMRTLCMEGNTVGIEAARAIGKALESQSGFERALWKDMFTGRMKTEIPKALEYLSSGLIQAQAKLVELDLSDNAFGPIGVEGILKLIKSPVCYSLQELRLNNNGLGITGGKKLAAALLECHKSSSASGTPLRLRVFISGRNRLENEGAQAMAAVFEAVGTLEEVEMPQNGICHPGILALSKAFACNPKLKHINLNDNTFTVKGAVPFAKVLPKLQELEILNLGDCLLRSSGARALASALSGGHTKLKEVHLGFNEIGAEVGLAVVSSLNGKNALTILDLNGNLFGKAGCEAIKNAMEEMGKGDALIENEDDESFSDDGEEGGGEDDDDEEEEEENSDSQEDSEEGEEEEDDDVIDVEGDVKEEEYVSPMRRFVAEKQKEVTVIPSDEPTSEAKGKLEAFIKSPTFDNYSKLPGDKLAFLFEMCEDGCNPTISELFRLFGLLASTVTTTSTHNLEIFNHAEILFESIFTDSFDDDALMATIVNELLVTFGFLKSEDKKFVPIRNLTGGYMVLENCCKKTNFPDQAKVILQFFIKDERWEKLADAKCRQRLIEALQSEVKS